LYQPPDHLNENELYHRSSFQVALLMFLTVGLYVFWWSYRVRRSAAALLGERDAAGWRSVCLIVPVVNLFLISEVVERIKVSAIRMGLKPPQALPAWAVLGMVGFMLSTRLPAPYSALAMLSFVPFALAHQYLERAELFATRGKAIARNFSIGEIFVIILGLGVRAFVMLAYSVDQNLKLYANAWLGWAVLVVVIAALVFFYHRGHQASQEKFAQA